MAGYQQGPKFSVSGGATGRPPHLLLLHIIAPPALPDTNFDVEEDQRCLPFDAVRYKNVSSCYFSSSCVTMSFKFCYLIISCLIFGWNFFFFKALLSHHPLFDFWLKFFY